MDPKEKKELERLEELRKIKRAKEEDLARILAKTEKLKKMIEARTKEKALADKSGTTSK